MSIVVHAPIAEVTVFEDRAHVVRRGLAHFERGRAVLEIPDIAGTLVDRTLAVKLLGPSSVRSTRVVRSRLPLAAGGDADVSEHVPVTLRAPQLRRVLDLTLADVARDAAAGDFDADATMAQWAGLLDGLEESHCSTPSAKPNQPERARLSTSLVIDVDCADTGPHPLQVDYVVTNAAWRPRYRAVLSGVEDQRVRFSTEASVWQNTGEDWKNVLLRFSTRRLGTPTRAPHLPSDVLRIDRPSKPPAAPAALRSRDGEEIGAALFPSDRGVEQLFQAAERAEIASDGALQSVPLGSFESEVRSRSVVRDDFEPHPMWVTELRNDAGSALLAGPLDLIVEGGWRRRMGLGFVPAGASFAIGWFPDERVIVTREPITNGSQANGKQGGQTDMRLCIANLSAETCSLQIEAAAGDSGALELAPYEQTKTTTRQRA